MPRFGLGRERRVRKTAEYGEIRRLGHRVRGKGFSVNYLERETGEIRLGLVVSRKVGNAVCRNRLKRYIREHFRLKREHIEESLSRSGSRGGIDLVFIAAPGSGKFSRQQVDHALDGLLRQALQGKRGHGAKGGSRG